MAIKWRKHNVTIRLGGKMSGEKGSCEDEKDSDLVKIKKIEIVESDFGFWDNIYYIKDVVGRLEFFLIDKDGKEI